MRLHGLLLSVVLVAAVCSEAVAIYGVRISDLDSTPLPANPIRIWGRVTSESPLKLSDGRGEVTFTGKTATINQFLILDGWWDGSTFAVVPNGPGPDRMIYIPAGSFLMGNNGSEPYSYSHELPQHSVYLSGYWIGKYEVTRGEYAQFIAAGGYTNQSYWSSDGWNWRLTAWSNNPSAGPPRIQPNYWGAVQNFGSGSFTQTDDHPVVGITYYEAEAYCNWAGGHLPTEAQWERAARWTGSYPNVYPWGNTWDAEKCNNYYDHNEAGGGYWKYQTAPVGSYPTGVSPCGCMDVAGNVSEWCMDWYLSDYYSQTPAGGWIDPLGPASGGYRMMRGGGWNSDNNAMRCASRGNAGPVHSMGRDDFGFRLAR